MPSNTTIQKAERLVREGRVVFAEDGETVLIRGDSGDYEVGLDARGKLACSCPARGECAHIIAAQIVKGEREMATSMKGGSPAPAWGLTAAQVTALNADLPAEVVKIRNNGGVAMSYVAGHYVIRVANDLFGFAGWKRETKDMRLVAEREYKGRGGKTGWLVAYVARVAVSVRTDDGWVESDGWGYGEGIDYSNIGQAHESAIKEAETDAMKRAFVKWGDPFGLALYDPDKEHVELGDAAPRPTALPRDLGVLPPQEGGEGEQFFDPPTRDRETTPGETTFSNVGQLFNALMELGYRRTEERNALRDRAGLGHMDWPQLGNAGWRRVYQLALDETKEAAA